MTLKLINPDEFEVKYREAEARLRLYLSEQFGWKGSILFAAAIWCAALALFVFWTPGTDERDVLVLKRFAAFLTLAVPLSLISLTIPNARRNLFQAGALFILWFGTTRIILGPLQDFLPGLLVYLWLPCACGMAMIFLSQIHRFQRKWWIRVLFSAAFVSTFAVVFYLLFRSEHMAAGRLWRFRPYSILFAFLMFSFRENLQSQNTFLLAFNPFNAALGVLWPYDFRFNPVDRERLVLWWHGVLCLALALALFLLYRTIEILFPIDSRVLDYVLRIVFDIGVFNFIAGLVRAFGYQVRDATNFVVLAKTPADVWRKGNVYQYLFLLQAVYMPIVRLIPSRFVAVFVTMLFFQINRFGWNNFVALLARFTGLQVGFHHRSDYQLYFFGIKYLLFAFSIYISPRFWFVPRRALEFSRTAWFSIALTTGIMVGIDVVAAALAHALT